MTDFDFDSYLALPRLSGLRLSPDGARLIVTVARPAPDGKKMRSSIWQLDPAGEEPPRRLTRSAPGESSGAFMRDGSLLFTSSRPDPDRTPDDDDEEEVGRLWLLPAGGGEARIVAAPAGGVDAVVAAREADVAVFAAAVFPHSADMAADRERARARQKAGVDALLFEDFPIRFWDHYLGPRERHLFAAAVDAAEEGTVNPTDLTPDAGSALVDTEFDVTPDGNTIVTSWVDNSVLTRPLERLFAIDRKSGQRRLLAGDDDHSYLQPACSPDGRFVAVVRAEQSSPERAGDMSLWLVDLESGQGRDLTPELDLWPHNPVWAPDSSAVFFLADRRGAGALMRATLDGKVDVLAGEDAWSDAAPGPDGNAVYAIRASLSRAPHPARLDLDGQAPTVHALNSFAELDQAALPGTVERLTTDAGDGTRVESWLVLPPGASASQPAPLVVWVHGGPLSSWNSWSWRWNPQLMAARGYAVLLPDPALSTGYGLEFIARGWGRWGEEPYRDVLAAVDGALRRDDLDAERTALMGGSFGGYMANWVAVNTDRFRAIVTHASLWELRGFHGTTDSGPWWELEFGDPYTDPSRYEAASPHALVGQIRTPVLVIHGEKDHRVPISEALRLWTDLQRHGVEAKFLYYPDENHWILKPQNARLWYETVLAFLDHHVLAAEWQRPALL